MQKSKSKPLHSSKTNSTDRVFKKLLKKPMLFLLGFKFKENKRQSQKRFEPCPKNKDFLLGGEKSSKILCILHQYII